MAKALRRILRFRQLAEEQARIEVERAAQVARQVSTACTQQVFLERQQRSTLAESWVPQSQGPGSERYVPDDPSTVETVQESGWLMEEAVLEFFGWRRMRLEELREAELRRMEPLVETYKERRRELRQTEQLLEQRAAVEVVEQNRRAQAQTDEWFAQRNQLKQRREQHRTHPKKPEKSDLEPSHAPAESVHRPF